MTLPTISTEKIELAPGDELILRCRTWQDYEDLLAIRQNKSGLRIKYSSLTGEIRVMSPLPGHGKNVDMLADFVKALLRNKSQDWEAFTPITLKYSNLQGAEPDYCFYIENRQRILGKERIDLQNDPPPDLAIEVDLTSMTKPEDYQVIAPAELWIYRRSGLLIYQYDKKQYRESQTSCIFPDFDVKILMPQYVDRGWQVGSSVAVKEFEEFLKKGS